MTSFHDFGLLRAGLMLIAMVSLAGALNAQPEMDVSRAPSAIPNGGTYNFTPALGFTGPVPFTITNNGTTDLSITNPVTISNIVNCTASVATNPANTVTPGNSTTVTITLGSPDPGPYSFDVSIMNNDSDESPYTFTVSGTVPGDSGSSGDKDGGGGCTTGQDSGRVWLLVFALAAELAFAVRMGAFVFKR